ncbi:MAG: RDD family protein [bacterium]|nr:RDD family protein [bacterium]
MSDPLDAHAYDPPQSSLLPDEARTTADDASRSSRFVAASIDAVLQMAIYFPLMSLLGRLELSEASAVPPETAGEVFGALFTLPALVDVFIDNALSLALFVTLHGYLLADRGQTIGKRMLGIRIVGVDGRLVSFTRVFWIREASLYAVAVVPVVGSFVVLFELLLIFGSARRCGHDHLAGTRVVVAD